MRVRRPPGRAGRIWLQRRLAVARRGQDVLEQKRRALMRELERLESLRDEARREWESAAPEAESWWQRAAVLTGERPLELARQTARGRADVRIGWRNSLGVVYPADADVEPPPGELFPAGGSSALAFAAQAYARALEAAVRTGAADAACEQAAHELRATSLRLRAIERRWIPEHERALATLQLGLDESDREDAARIRWVVRRHAAARRSPA